MCTMIGAPRLGFWGARGGCTGVVTPNLNSGWSRQGQGGVMVWGYGGRCHAQRGAGLGRHRHHRSWTWPHPCIGAQWPRGGWLRAYKDRTAFPMTLLYHHAKVEEGEG